MTWTPNIPTQSTDDGKVIFWRLLVAKEFYLHALAHSHLPSPIDKMIAIHNFHNAIEIFLKTIVIHYNIHLEKNASLPSVITEIKKALEPLGATLPLSNQIYVLNDDRNLVQHQVHEPATSSLEQWRVYTATFFQESFQLYFGLDFEKFSRLDLIIDPQLRKILALSTQNIEQGLYQESLIITAELMDSLLDCGFGPDDLLENSFYALMNNPSTDEFDAIQDLIWAIVKTTDTLRVEVDVLSKGIDLQDFRKFLSTTPIFSYDDRAKKHIAIFGSLPDKETATWALDFLVDLIIKIQSQEGATEFQFDEEFFSWLINTNTKDFLIKLPQAKES